MSQHRTASTSARLSPLDKLHDDSVLSAIHDQKVHALSERFRLNLEPVASLELLTRYFRQKLAEPPPLMDKVCRSGSWDTRQTQRHNEATFYPARPVTLGQHPGATVHPVPLVMVEVREGQRLLSKPPHSIICVTLPDKALPYSYFACPPFHH